MESERTTRSNFSTPLASLISRRGAIQRLGLLTTGIAGGAILAGCGGDGGGTAFAQDGMDVDVLNFALNLEYLEAEYYLRGVEGRGLSEADRGSGAGPVSGGRQVNFQTPLIADYAREIAGDEEAHVRFLRGALGAQAVPAPAINFDAAFAALGFDPFANEANFLLGAFVFEDVGVTAYNGAAPLISDSSLLAAAASILAVEAYHAGNIRTVLLAQGQSNPTLIDLANTISATRDDLDQDGNKDQGITREGSANVVPADPSGLAFARTTTEVLRIVYVSPDAVPGGFFPNGLNGAIA